MNGAVPFAATTNGLAIGLSLSVYMYVFIRSISAFDCGHKSGLIGLKGHRCVFGMSSLNSNSNGSKPSKPLHSVGTKACIYLSDCMRSMISDACIQSLLICVVNISI